MKTKLLLIFCAIMFSITTFAQTVTTNPAIIQDGYTGDVILRYDPAGSAMASATKAYAHIGVLTESSTGDSDWKCAPEWRGGEEKYKMAKDGSDWVLNLGNIYDYFGACASEKFTALVIVFNDGPDGELEGKNHEGKDFKIDIVPLGLAVLFDGTSSSGIVEAGADVSFTANATTSALLELKKNGTLIKSETGTIITYTETLSAAGDYIYEVYGDGELQDTRMVSVVEDAPNETKPANITDGVNYGSDNTKATLCIYVKDKNGVLPSNIFLVGEFNNWNPSNSYQMKKSGNTGYWWFDLEGLTAGQEYAYQYWVKIGSSLIKISDPYSTKVLHNDDQWEPRTADPTLKPFPSGQEGYVSVLQTDKPEFNWSSETLNFQRPNKTNLVIYELWAHDFAPNKTYKGLTERLDYLENLGINAIELLPPTEFEGNTSWGYNPTHYFAPDKAYGSENDLKTLVDECHKRGIAVIADMVFNHATGLAPHCRLYWDGTLNKVAANNPWLNHNVPSSDHSAHVFDDWNHGSPQTKDMFTRSLKFWMEEYKIDGFRMDLAQGFCGDDCSGRVGITFDYYNNGVKAVHDDGYFILESWPDNDNGERQDYINFGMMCWNYDNMNIHNAWTQTAMGWLKDGDNTVWGGIQDGWVAYSESHDEERNFYKAKEYGNGTMKSDLSTRMDRVALNVAFITMQDGPKMMWQFQELGYDYSINTCEDGTIGECRISPKPNPERLGWYKNADRMKAYQKVGQILQLRTRLAPEVFEGNPEWAAGNSGDAARSIGWGSGNNRIFIVGNFKTADGQTWVGNETITLPTGNSWYDYLADATTTQPAGTSVSLAPGEVKVYTTQRYALPDVPNEYNFDDPVSVPETDEDSDKSYIYPTIVDDFTKIISENQVNEAYLVSISGATNQIKVDANNNVDLSNYSKGMYLLVVKFENTEKVFKLIKK